MCMNIIPTAPWSPWRNEEQQRLKTCCSEKNTAQYIIYNINRAVWNSRRPAKTSRQSCPGVPLPLPRPPKKKTSTFYPKTSPLNFHHQCPDPRIDPIVKPPFANPVYRTHSKDSHPKLTNDRALTPSRTRISSPLVIAREQRRASSNNLPRRNTTATRARPMGQDYPPTGPSPGANLRWEPWHQGDRAPQPFHPGARAFFLFFLYFFWELHFLRKKWKKTVFSLCFSSLSLSISFFLCTHRLGSF
jgi:hypothetical protein